MYSMPNSILLLLDFPARLNILNKIFIVLRVLLFMLTIKKIYTIEYYYFLLYLFNIITFDENLMSFLSFFFFNFYLIVSPS